jgi:peptidoglycan/xylan/chitin deacetylase (PgdA/CDA1 family)
MRNKRKQNQISAPGLVLAIVLASLTPTRASEVPEPQAPEAQGSEAQDSRGQASRAQSSQVSEPAISTCPQKGALGTARVLTVDPSVYPRVGLKSFPQTLPLRDHEVVLTFDDGPSPRGTRKVLAALQKECVRATFFLVGRPAADHAALVRRIAAEGHTVGYHTWSHQSLMRIKPGDATEEIDHGIAAVEMALHGVATTTPSTPFFRFPYFDSTPETLDLLQARGMVVFGADFWASDWKPMTAQQQLQLLIERLKVARKGIILLHDPRTQTAAMLPAFLRYLHDNDYSVVHLVPRAMAVELDEEH